MMTRNATTKTFAALFALIMVVSMMAPAAGAGLAASDGDVTTDFDADDIEAVEQFDEDGIQDVSEGEPAQQSPDDVDVDSALEREFEDANGDVEVVVRLGAADVDDVESREAVVNSLKLHAAESQQEMVRFADSTEHVELKQQLWITNAVLLEVDPSHVSIDEIAATQGVERLHTNFELTIDDGESENTNESDSANETDEADDGEEADDADDGDETTETDESDDGDEATETDESDGDANATESAEEVEEEDVSVLPSSMQSDDYETTYGLDMINATEVWDQHNTQGEGVAVAVLDTGIDPDHPDLDLYTDDPDDPTYPGGYMAFDSDGNQLPDEEPEDTSGHGTHVSGTVAGAEDPAGVDESFGVAPGIDLLHGQAIPGGGGSFVQVAASMEWAVDDTHADIVTMSLGADGYNDDMVEPSENARDAGVVLVASAGNSGDGVSGSPGNVYPNFASGAVDEDGDVASFSSGEEITTSTAYPDAPDYWPDEYVVPNAAAPGVNVLSSVPGGDYDDTYSGTSMSAPHKAGSFALMLSAAGGDADREMLIDSMEDTAWKPDDWDEPEDEYDTRYGMGIIDVAAATDQVALDSGVTGTVTDTDGEPIEDATIMVGDFETETDADGEYTVLSPPGNVTVHADGFGYEPAEEDVEIPDDETFVEQDFELDDALGVELLQDQPEGIEGGDEFDVMVDVANLETYSVERTGGYDGELTFYLDGEEIEEGEEVDVGDVTGEVTLTVSTELETDGEFELDHTFMGAGDTIDVTTGPTEVFAEFTPVAVVDDGTFGEDTYDRLDDELPEMYELSLISGSEAVDAAEMDEYEAYVVQDIDEMYVEDFAMYTDGVSAGVVWLDQWGTGSDAIPAKSSVLDNPDSTSDSFTAPNPDFEIAEEHEIFDGIGEEGDTLPIHSATFADHSWFDGYDGETVGYIQAGGVTDGDGIAVDEEKRSVLLSSFGTTTFVGPEDFSDDADAMLANAASWAAEEPPVELAEEQPDWSAPGEMFGSEFLVNDLEMIAVSLHEDSTADEDELDLYVGGGANAFDEWRMYDPPMSADDYMVEIESDEETVGSVILETTFVFADSETAVGDIDDPEHDAAEEVTITTGPTAVYEQPLTVGPEGDVETIQEAVDLAPDGAEIVVEDGTFEETVSIDDTEGLTITAAEGASPTVVAPEDATAADVIDIDAPETTISGLSVDGADELHGIHAGANNASVSDIDAMNAGYGVWASDSSDGDVSNVTATDSDYAVYLVDASDTDVSYVEATNLSVTGVAVSDSADIDVMDVDATDVENGVVADGSEDVSVMDVNVDDAADTAVASIDSDYVEVTNVEAIDVGYGVYVDDGMIGDVTDITAMDVDTGVHVAGGMVGNVTDAYVDNASTGIALEDGADADYVADNEIANASYGFALSGFGTSGEAVMNDIDAETGVLASDIGSDVAFHFNDLEHTDTAVVAEEGYFEAPLNWFGEDGPMANNGVEGDVRYSPFLTAPADEVDMDTTELAVDLTMEADNTYTVGVPATTDQTIDEVFQDDFEGAVYGYDAELEEWEMLSGDDGVSALSAILVVAEEDTHVTLDFQHDDEAVTPGSEHLHHGWNLVSPSAYDHAENAFAEEISGETYQVENWMPANEHADGDIGQYTVADDQVNPFGGYWTFVPAEDAEYTISSELDINPTKDDYYDALVNVDDADDGDNGDSPGEVPDDADVAVIDEDDYFDGEIADTLEGELDGWDVDTLTADEVLDEMGDYDVLVVQRLGDDDLADDFFSEVASDQGVVYLDSHQGSTAEGYPDGVLRLHNVLDDPAERDSESLDTDTEPVTIEIHADHPIFEDVGMQGDHVEVVDDGTTWGSWFEGYSGDVLADADFSPSDEGEFQGGSVAIDEDSNTVLNTAIAMDFFHDNPDDYTDEGLALFGNSVEQAAALGATADETSEETTDEELAEAEDRPSIDAGAAAAAPA